MRRLILALAPLTLLTVGSSLSAQTGDNVVEEQRFQDFVYQVRADPINDTKSYRLLTVTGDTQSWGEVVTQGAGFGLLCFEGKSNPRVIVMTAEYLSEGSVTVYYRFDGREPVGPVEWRVVNSSLESSLLAATTSSEMNTFFDDARTAAEMVFRIEDNIDEGIQHTYSFSMLGISKGMTQMPCVE